MDPDEVNELGGGDVPLAFRMMEHLPSISASLGFALNRGSNTLMGGGFMDDRGRTPGFGEGRFRRRNIGPGKLGGFASGSMTPTNPTAKAYYGSSARRARLASSAGSAQGKMALGKGSRVNHITMRPRALARYNSLTIFNASQNTPFYSPFQFASKVVGNQFGKNAAFREAVYGSKTAAIPEEGVFARGTMSMITAGRKLDVLERKAKFNPDGKAANRAGRKVLKAQEQVRRLAQMNNPAALGAINSAIGAGQKVGLTGSLMAEAGGTAGTRYMQGYFRGALGMQGLGDDTMRGAGKAVSHMQTAIKAAGIQGPFDERVLKGSVIKNLGGFTNALKVATKSKQGATVLGARTAAMAIPGLNLLATASLVYDLGKMGGEVVKSGINLAKDAVKSMKGSMDKPLFGMGYKDNEVAATSRSRGVMAIQNSRLNARSALGSEAGMMASHFG
jgi:hypothetical protein